MSQECIMRRNGRHAVTTVLLLFAVASLALGQETVLISFEQNEGFPAAGGRFTNLSTNNGIILRWTNDSAVDNGWFTDKGPGGIVYPETPSPVSGKQVAVFGQGGVGVNVGTMHLNKKSGCTLTRFYWAWRGNGDSRPGGNAWLETEYFDLNGKSLGKDKFQGDYHAYMNFHWYVFRAKKSTAKLTISDWASATDPAGPVGQETMYNFIQIEPYLE